MDKWEKVVAFDRLLKRCRYSVALPDILAELGCCEATFHRVRNFMRDNLGAPIVFDQVRGGYRYDAADGAPFELPGFWFTKNEIELLLSLDYAVESMDGVFFRELLGPLRGRFEPALKAQKTDFATMRRRIKIIPIASRKYDVSIFRAVASAVLRQKRLIIHHRGLPDIAVKRRCVSPQSLVRYRDNWYLDAFCHLRSELRTFAVNRIEKAEPASGKFHAVSPVVQEKFYTESYGIFTGPAEQTAIIDFTGCAAREVATEQWHPQQTGQWLDAQTYRLSVPYGHSRELIMDILRWGEEAVVKGPPQLHGAIKTRVLHMQKNYEK